MKTLIETLEAEIPKHLYAPDDYITGWILGTKKAIEIVKAHECIWNKKHQPMNEFMVWYTRPCDGSSHTKGQDDHCGNCQGFITVAEGE